MRRRGRHAGFAKRARQARIAAGAAARNGRADGVQVRASYTRIDASDMDGRLSRRLPTIDVPVLVLCGERDAIAPRPLSEEIAQGIPDATLAVVEDAGHVANADDPQRVQRAAAVAIYGLISIRCNPAYPLARVPRTKPASVMLNSRARSTARLLGAETEHTIGIRATALFCRIS